MLIHMSVLRYLFLLWLAISSSHSFAFAIKTPAKISSEQLLTSPISSAVWQPEIITLADWRKINAPLRDIEFSKFLIDIKSKKIYFFDAKVFPLHVDFVFDYLLKKPRDAKNLKQFNRNYSTRKPNFILGYLTHYPSQKEWVFSFWEGDTIEPHDIVFTAALLKKHFKIAPLKFRPDSSYQEHVAQHLPRWRVPILKNAQIYKAMNFQSFNEGVAVGVLRIVPPAKEIENLYVDQNDIVVLQQSYPDISPVKGIITTQFSTPLSHVNLRAHAWNIPNAVLKSVLKDFSSLDGKWVKLTVKQDGLILREASPDEVLNAKQAMIDRKVIHLPRANLDNVELASLSRLVVEHASSYGAKTTHLGQMMRAGLPIPEGFGIPFYYYLQHIKQHHLDIRIRQIIEDSRFKEHAWRKVALLGLQKEIHQAPIDAQAFAAIKKMWKTDLHGVPVFARSSTNSEDLVGFNGAGLYDSVPNIRDEVALEAGIKQVWASLWNERAVNEREHFGISHFEVYASVLIQRAINATASGVLLTTDIWSHQPSTFTINAKWGLGMKVVDGQKVAEQILYDSSNDGARVISRSDESTMLVFNPAGGIKEVAVPPLEVIMTDRRAKQLGMLGVLIQQVFEKYPIVDVEWVLEFDKNGKDRFWIVQARPYVGKN